VPRKTGRPEILVIDTVARRREVGFAANCGTYTFSHYSCIPALDESTEMSRSAQSVFMLARRSASKMHAEITQQEEIMKIDRTVLGIAMVVGLASAIGLAQTTASCTYTTFLYPGASNTYATGINDYNTVVGYASLNGKQIGFIRWANGGFTKVDIGSIRTELFGRNNIGVSVGAYTDANGGGHAFLLTNNGYQKIDYPGAFSTELFGINNYNSSVGEAITTTNEQLGIKRWSNGAFVTIQGPHSTGFQVNGINDSGVMVGMVAASTGPDTMEEWVLINGKYQQFTDPKADSLSTWVSGINNNQVIVGTGYNGGFPPTSSHGFFIVNGQVKEMPSPSGGGNLEANGINKSGLIVGAGSFGGVEKGFIAKCQ